MHRGRRDDSENLQRQILAALAVVAFLAAWYLTPLSDWITDAVVMAIPVQQDVDLGMAAVAQAGYRYAADDFGIADIGRRIVASSPELQSSKFRWSFRVIHENYVNAFAYPGGFIFVTDTLVKQLKASYSEIAAVLGHEIGHVVNRHSQKRLIKDQIFAFLYKVIMYEDGDGHRETFGEAAGELLLKSAHTLGSLGFSRANEYEADSTGWSVCLNAGIDPRGFKSFFEKLLALEGGSGRTSWESTHPGTKDRIHALDDKWEALTVSDKRRFGGGSDNGGHGGANVRPDSMYARHQERRIARDGKAYTKAAFVEWYGGTKQWDAAPSAERAQNR